MSRDLVLRPRRAIAGVLLALMSVTACYQNVPLSSAAAAPRTRVVLDLNDRGRVGMGERLGAEVASVEGRLERASDSVIVVQITQIVDLRGASTKWAGESVDVRRDYVSNVRERRFSRVRTAIVAGVVVVALGALIATRGLFGLGGSDDGKGSDGGDS